MSADDARIERIREWIRSGARFTPAMLDAIIDGLLRDVTRIARSEPAQTGPAEVPSQWAESSFSPSTRSCGLT